jgi:hypothetical protein
MAGAVVGGLGDAAENSAPIIPINWAEVGWTAEFDGKDRSDSSDQFEFDQKMREFEHAAEFGHGRCWKSFVFWKL